MTKKKLIDLTHDLGHKTVITTYKDKKNIF